MANAKSKAGSKPPQRTDKTKAADPDLVLLTGKVELRGTVTGSIQVDGGELNIAGRLVGDLENRGGIVHIPGEVTGKTAGPRPHTITNGEPAVARKLVSSRDSLSNPQDLVVDDDTLLLATDVGKRYARSLRKSMRYGISDLARSAIGRRVPEDLQLRESEFWALREISFRVKKGDSIGVMGTNGSGKSTLMRLVAGIIPPDEGAIMVRGRAAGLIGIGAGFHPHLSGKENIFLNSAILGVSNEETEERIDDIIGFSELANAIESPVAMYSTGMRMRLGFSILTTLAPELLILDEVFAVGDLAFRQKCLSRLEEIREESAILLVAHVPMILRQVCDTGLWIEQGEMRASGSIEEVTELYQQFIDRRINDPSRTGVTSGLST